MTMFEIDSKYVLEHEYSRQLTELEGDVDIMMVGGQPDEDVNDIVVYYNKKPWKIVKINIISFID